MGLYQNGKFWRSPLGVLELIKCKALRVRATGVYSRKRLSPNPDNNAAVCNYGTPSFESYRINLNTTGSV